MKSALAFSVWHNILMLCLSNNLTAICPQTFRVMSLCHSELCYVIMLETKIAWYGERTAVAAPMLPLINQYWHSIYTANTQQSKQQNVCWSCICRETAGGQTLCRLLTENLTYRYCSSGTYLQSLFFIEHTFKTLKQTNYTHDMNNDIHFTCDFTLV